MSLNPSVFNKYNVADACTIWNILSSKVLWQATQSAKCEFCCTGAVKYECLDKPRKSISIKEKELQNLLKSEQSKGNFTVYHLDINDLLDVDVLRQRKNLGMGELSSIAFARKTRQAFITDDQGARKLANAELGVSNVQTTPHLFGWLMYERFLTDGDKQQVIEQHLSCNGLLKKHFEVMYQKALEYKLMNHC